MKLVEVEAKSIIVESKLPDADYVINPYTGCRFGCSYCYASFMGRFVGEPIEEWGNYVYVKTNAVDLAKLELKKMSLQRQQGTILLSSVTDPYQGAEAKYRLTRGILAALLEASYPGTVSVLTKSPLVTRDIDLIRDLKQVEVGLTVTTTDDKVSKWLEVRAPRATRRIAALRRLNEANIPTYAFLGPLLPHFVHRPDLLEDLVAQIAESGTREVYVEHINLKQYIRLRMDPLLESEPEDVRETYRVARQNDHRSRLNDMVVPLLERYGLRLRLGQVLYHNSKSKQPASEG